MNITSFRAVVVLEVDPKRSHRGFPVPLGRSQADELCSVLSTQLLDFHSGVADMGLSFPAALYGQSQLLSPGMPIFDQLERLYIGSLGSRTFSASRLALCAVEGRMGVSELQPDAESSDGSLLLLPFVLLGEPGVVEELAAVAQRQMLAQGAVTGSRLVSLGSSFSLEALHANLFTLDDLNELLDIRAQESGSKSY